MIGRPTSPARLPNKHNDDDNRVYQAYKARIWSPSSDQVRR